jgi:hypothetical protein
LLHHFVIPDYIMEVKYDCYQPWRKYYIKAYFRNQDSALGYLITICRTYTCIRNSQEPPPSCSHTTRQHWVITMSDRRNCYLTFVRSNRFKVGNNLLSNRLRSISNVLSKISVSFSRDKFKTFCKINIIQKGLTVRIDRCKNISLVIT